MTRFEPDELINLIRSSERSEDLGSLYADDEDLLDDLNLMVRWEQDDLSEQEHQKLLSQLKEDRKLRQKLVQLLDAKVIENPLWQGRIDEPLTQLLLELEDYQLKFDAGNEAAESNTQPSATSPIPRSQQNWWKVNRRRWIGGAIACTVSAIAIFALYPRFDFEKALANANSSIQEKDYESAYRTLLSAHERQPKDQLKIEIESKLVLAANEKSRQALSQGQFGEVIQTSEKLLGIGLQNPSLTNLELQAKLKHEFENSFVQNPFVMGYDPGIESAELPKEMNAEFSNAVQSFPASSIIHLNYAHWLIQNGAISNARTQLANVAPDSSQQLVSLGLGIISFLEGRRSKSAVADLFEEAARQFEDSTARSEDNRLQFASRVNLALSLKEQGNQSEAIRQLNLAKELASDPDLMKVVEQTRRLIEN